MSLLIKEKFSFASSNGINTINGFVIRKENAPYKAIIQISHGMTEYAERYEPFMNFMAENGFVMVAHDHLGHKNSVNSKEELGFFASVDGYKCVLSDLATTAGRMKKSFPQLKLFLLGHSMGSFYARAFGAKYPHLVDGLLISGTGSSNPMAGPGLFLLKLMIKFKGEKYRSKPFAKLAFSNYLDKIENMLFDFQEDINLGTLAEKLGLSTRQTSRILRKNYNSTFSEMFCERRLDIAETLLRNTDMTVAEIVEYVNFPSESYFYARFKKRYKMTPTSYRETRLKNSNIKSSL